MMPMTLGFALLGMAYLGKYSEQFRSLSHSMKALIVFGYLKPNDLRYETEKGIFFKKLNSNDLK